MAPALARQRQTPADEGLHRCRHVPGWSCGHHFGGPAGTPPVAVRRATRRGLPRRRGRGLDVEVHWFLTAVARALLGRGAWVGRCRGRRASPCCRPRRGWRSRALRTRPGELGGVGAVEVQSEGRGDAVPQAGCVDVFASSSRQRGVLRARAASSARDVRDARRDDRWLPMSRSRRGRAARGRGDPSRAGRRRQGDRFAVRRSAGTGWRVVCRSRGSTARIGAGPPRGGLASISVVNARS